jgi:putative transposase
VRLLITAGQCGDAPQAEGLLEGFQQGMVGHVVADAAYDSDAIRERARRLRAKVCIRPNPTRRVRKRYDKERYRHRNVIERFFGRIKRFRRVATRYEKKAINFAGFVWLAAFVSEVF